MPKIKDMTDEELRELIPELLKEERMRSMKEFKHKRSLAPSRKTQDAEAEKRRIIQQVQSLCKHLNRGVLSLEGHNVVYCQDCLKKFYHMEV